MSKIGKERPKEYSDKFDELRQNRVELSFHKYGTAADNFGMKLVNALESHDMCIEKYKKTGNTEYLADLANYAMFRYMWPAKGEYFKHTDSSESAGIEGMSIKEIEAYRDNNY